MDYEAWQRFLTDPTFALIAVKDLIPTMLLIILAAAEIAVRVKEHVQRTIMGAVQIFPQTRNAPFTARTAREISMGLTVLTHTKHLKERKKSLYARHLKSV